MEDLNVSENTTVVAEQSTQAEMPTGNENLERTGENNVATAEPQKEEKPQRDFEKDAAYAKIRRENEKLANTLKQCGFTGESTEEIIDKATAYYQDKPIEEVTKERKASEENEALKAELEYFKQTAAEKMMEDDLREIQKTHPEIKSLHELGDTFFKLIGTGEFDAVEAAEAALTKKNKETITPPKSIGKLNQAAAPEKEFFTSEELDSLSSKDLDNPKIYEKAMKSMIKLSKKN